MPDEGIYAWGTAWEHFQKRLNEIGEMIDKGTCPYATLVLDSLTTWGNIALDYVLKNSGHKASDPVDPGRWGMQMGLMETVIDQLTAWPLNLVVLAHIQRDTNMVTQNVEHLPLITGKLAGKIGVYFTDVVYTDIKGEGANAKFIMHTEKSAMRRQSKSQSGIPTGTETKFSELKKYVRMVE
jgi:hypothetical protein